jgi:hypothetical protein
MLKFITTLFTTKDYGRGLEIASGIGLWLTALALPYHDCYECLFPAFILPIWAWLLFIIGVGQVGFSSPASRVTFNILSSIFWGHLAFASYAHSGAINLITAATAPYTLAMMFVIGSLLGDIEERKRTYRRE